MTGNGRPPAQTRRTLVILHQTN